MSTKESDTVSSPDALVYIHSALAADPHKFTPALHLEAAAELVELRAWDEAEALYRGLLKNAPSSRTEACMGLGRVALKRGRPAEAVSYFRTALAQDPTHVPALLELAAILCTDDLAEAEALYRAVLRGEADHPAALIGLARITRLRAHSNLDSAMRILEASHKEAQQEERPSSGEAPPVLLTSLPTVKEEDSGGNAALLERVAAAQTASSSPGPSLNDVPAKERPFVRRVPQSLPSVDASPPLSPPIKSSLPNIHEEMSLQFLWTDVKVHDRGSNAVLLAEAPAAQSASSSLSPSLDEVPAEEQPTVGRVPPTPRPTAHAPSPVHPHHQVDSFLHAEPNRRRSGTVALACATVLAIPVAIFSFDTIKDEWHALRNHTGSHRDISNGTQAAPKEARSSMVPTTGAIGGASFSALRSISLTPDTTAPSPQRDVEPGAVAWVADRPARGMVEPPAPQPAASMLSEATFINAPAESKDASILTPSSSSVGHTTNVTPSSLMARPGESDSNQPTAKDAIADPTGMITSDSALLGRSGALDQQTPADANARVETKWSLQAAWDKLEPVLVDGETTHSFDGLLADRNDATGSVHVEEVLELDERTTGEVGSLAASDPLLQAPTARDVAEGSVGASARPTLSDDRRNMPSVVPDILASGSRDALSGAPPTTQVPSLPAANSAPTAEALWSSMQQGPPDLSAAPAMAAKLPPQPDRNEAPAVRLQDGLTAPQTERLLARAKTLLDHRDMSGARLILEHLVRVGNRQAAFLLAQTYDPRLQVPWQGHSAYTNATRAEELYRFSRNRGAGQTADRVTESR